jgi:hypothetical protein
MDCLFREQEDGLVMGELEEGYEEEPEWAEADMDDLETAPVATSQSKRNLLFEVRFLTRLVCSA